MMNICYEKIKTKQNEKAKAIYSELAIAIELATIT